jgi:3-oxoacyl-[acyl-carrier protein] reductase
MRMHDLAHTTPADYDDHFNLNVKGPLFLIQAAVPHIPPNSGGRIILISTGLTSVATVQPGHLLYAATKGAVEQMVRTLSKELAPRGITVNAVAPGPTATELFFNGKTEGLVDAMKKQSPFGRLGDPTEIAGVLTFLAGGESSWVSGQTVRVNGANMV